MEVPSESLLMKPSSILKFSSFLVIFVAVLSGIFVNWPPPSLSSELFEWRENGNFYKFVDKYNGIPYTVFYRDDLGSGNEILLCLHGFPTSSFDWKKIYGGLKQQFSRIIAPDFIGLGFSEKPTIHRIISTTGEIIKKEQNYSLFQQADVVEALLKSLNVTRVHILAHDYGDTVAQELTFRYNQNKTWRKQTDELTIRSLTLLNGGIIPDAHRPMWMQRLLLYPTMSSIVISLSNYWLFKIVMCSLFAPNTQPSNVDLWDWWSQVRCNEGELALAKLMQYIPERHANKRRWIRSLQEADFPVQMIYGKLDPINPPPFEDKYRTLFPRANLTVLHETGHYVQWESPSETLASIKLFITNRNKFNNNSTNV